MKNICKNCGKEYEFEPRRGTYKFTYCSDTCKKEYNAKDKLPQMRICEHCGKEYWWDGTSDKYIQGKVTVDSKRFCSFECGKAYKYEKAKKSTIDKYGAIGFGVKELRDKGRQTTLEKYGCETYNNRDAAKQTTLDKYGVENISQLEENKEKVKNTWNNKTAEELQEIANKHIKTNQERYGVDNISQVQEIKNKITKTWNDKSEKEIKDIINKRENSTLKEYGVNHYSKTNQFKDDVRNTWNSKTEEELKNINDKHIKTNLERYGVTHFMKSKKFLEEYKKNMIQKFGIEYPYLSKEAQEKKKETCLENWGTEYSVTHPDVRKKIKETFIEKYGVDNPFSSEELREKGKKTCLEHYGVEYGCISKPCIEASNDTISKTNIKFYEMLKNLNIEAQLEFPLKKYSYDLKVNDILVEINPTFTHNSSIDIKMKNIVIDKKDPNYHLNKSKLAEDNGYRCIHVFDWDSPYKIAQMLKEKQTLYARNLVLAEITEDETKAFLEQYHLQGNCNGQSVRLGLYRNTELIQIITFGKPRYNKKYQWELLRLCTKAEYKVVGGAEKLFKHFISTYNPDSIISYCDNAKFTGDIYKRLGMILKDKGKPSKHWCNPRTGRHITDNLLRQRGYSQLHGDKEHKKGESNELLMLEAGYLEVYDCGQSTWIWNK